MPPLNAGRSSCSIRRARRSCMSCRSPTRTTRTRAPAARPPAAAPAGGCPARRAPRTATTAAGPAASLAGPCCIWPRWPPGYPPKPWCCCDCGGGSAAPAAPPWLAALLVADVGRPGWPIEDAGVAAPCLSNGFSELSASACAAACWPNCWACAGKLPGERPNTSALKALDACWFCEGCADELRPYSDERPAALSPKLPATAGVDEFCLVQTRQTAVRVVRLSVHVALAKRSRKALMVVAVLVHIRLVIRLLEVWVLCVGISTVLGLAVRRHMFGCLLVMA